MTITCATHGEVEGIQDKNKNVWCPHCVDGWAHQWKDHVDVVHRPMPRRREATKPQKDQ